MTTSDFDLQLARAVNAVNAGQIEQADPLVTGLLAARRADPRVLLLAARVRLAQYDFEEADKILRKCLKLQPRQPAVHLCLAQVRQAQGRFADALSRYDRVLRLVPDHPIAIIGKAEALQWKGDYDAAYELLKPHVDAGGEPPELAHVHAGTAMRLGRFDEVIAVASRHAQSTAVAPFLRQHLYLLVGQAHEKRGEIDEAFAAFRAGNDAIDTPSNADARIDAMRRITDVFSTDTLAGLPRASQRSELPVFIVGMPRCGSTLVETIIDAHPRAVGLGEIAVVPNLADNLQLEIPSSDPYPDCVRDLEQPDVDRFGRQLLDRLKKRARGARRAVDKTLLNYEHLGLIELLLPAARVVHCVRDPLDTCLSCYAQPLPLPGHAYACRLDDLGRVFLAYQATIAHFRDVSTLPMLEVQYESLVADPEPQTRRIIDFLGLEWNDRCLEPYATGRRALTLSDDQVRRPIYRSSVGRAERFGEHLSPLIDALNQDPPAPSRTR